MSYWCWCYWQNITLDIAEFQDKYPDSLFMVCGDTNGRAVTLNDYIEYDNCDYLPLPDFYTEDSNDGNRCNMDRVINSQDRRIIDLCQMCNLKILNGRVGADANIGKYNVFNGSSTVDYFMSPPTLFDIVYDLQVKMNSTIIVPLNYSFVYLIILVRSQLQKPKRCHGMLKKLVTIDKIFPMICQSMNLTVCYPYLNRHMVDHRLRWMKHKSFAVKIPSTNDKPQHKYPIWANEKWTTIRKSFFRMNEKQSKRYPNDHDHENMVTTRKQYKSSVKLQRKHNFTETEKLLNAHIKDVKLY